MVIPTSAMPQLATGELSASKNCVAKIKNATVPAAQRHRGMAWSHFCWNAKIRSLTSVSSSSTRLFS